MEQTIKITRKAAEAIIKATFPAYTGRKIKVELSESMMLYDTTWSGGTKNDFVVISADGRHAVMPTLAPWGNHYEGAKVELTPQIIVVEHSYFCGHDMGLTIHANPCYAPKWLEASN